MRTSFHVIACVALTGTCIMAGFHPAFGRKAKPHEIAASCYDDELACVASCKANCRDYTNKCKKSYDDCLDSGGIFIDPITGHRHRGKFGTITKPPYAGNKTGGNTK